jgi:hypothetical protein
VTGDIRKQLSEALDEAEAEARNFSTRTWTAVTDGQYGPAVRTGADKDAEWSREVNYQVWRCDDEADGCPDSARQWIAEAEHIARWDPSTVLRLIERDRALLADLQAVEAECSDAEAGATPPEVRPLMVTGVERRVLREQFERAAAFWLGGAPASPAQAHP